MIKSIGKKSFTNLGRVVKKSGYAISRLLPSTETSFDLMAVIAVNSFLLIEYFSIRAPFFGFLGFYTFINPKKLVPFSTFPGLGHFYRVSCGHFHGVLTLYWQGVDFLKKFIVY